MTQKSTQTLALLRRRCYFSYAYFLVVLFIVSLSNLSLAARIPERISFQNIVENKDFTMGEGAAFLQDSQGFMWLGGGTALTRYDGYEFRQFDYSPDDTKPDKKRNVAKTHGIFEDSRHNMWIATGAGLFRYDPHTETLIKIKDDNNLHLKISTTDFFRVIELPSGEILASSRSGLFVINSLTNKYSVIAPEAEKENWIHELCIYTAYLDPKGELWLGTANGLEHVDWKTKIFTPHDIDPNKPDSSPTNLIRDIVTDKEGKLWLATNNGVVHYDPKTRLGKRYVNNINDRYSLSGNDVWKLLLDSQGILWIASDGGGVSVYVEKNDRFINYQAEVGRAGALNTNKVRTIYEDRNSDIWVGNFPGGVNFFDRSTAAITTYTANASNPNSLSNTSVLSTSEDKNGNLWLGTDGGGLNFFDREKNEFSHFKNNPSDPTSLNGDSVLTTFIDSTGLVWVGTWEKGIASYDPANKKFTRYPFSKYQDIAHNGDISSTMNNPTAWSIKEDSHHYMWIGSSYGGVSKYNPQTKLFTTYRPVANDVNSLSAELVWTTIEDSNNNIWLGTTLGLNLMHQEKATFSRFVADPTDPTALSNSNVLSILEDSKKQLWLGTDAGLNLFNRETKTFTVYNKDSGFLDETIRDILEDADGIIWVSTNNGFSSFNPETKKIKNYNRIGGRLVGAFAMHSGTVSRRGEIILGGVEGLRIFNPRELSENKIAPPVVLTDFKVFSDSITAGGVDGLLTKVINHTDLITLDYKKSMFTFSFSSLNFRDSEKNKYVYKLEGFDKDWINAGTQRTAKYTNLDAGKYVFTVKGSNNDGVWNQTGKSITIIQLPPPWKTWWAYALYTLAVISIIALFFHAQRKKRHEVEEQNRLLEIKVFERTAELREKNSDIQTMLSNMHQGLFTIEVGGKIHPEYSHFLEEIFETNNISGHNAFELLFGKAAIGSDTLDKIKVSVAAIIGEDDMNFEFNSHLLLNEYEADINGQPKLLSLDWNPVIANGVVTKLMVSVRDITLLKKMESEAHSKKSELEIISQLLNISAKKYFSFATSVKRFIAENRLQIKRNEQCNDTIIAQLLRNMHTIKGNCRTFNLTYLSNVVHEVESVYSTLKTDTETHWNRETLLTDLERIETTLQEYERVYYTVLGRGDSNSETRNQEGFWADRKAIDTIQRCIDSSNQQFPALNQSNNLLPIQTLLNRALSNPISEVLSDVVASLPSIAIELDKEVPQIIIDENQVRIKSSATELMTDIFSHILRNSVDHGIETAEVRIQAGKPSAGTIHIRAIPQQEFLHIYIKDDGQGINIDRLFQKGIDIGKWKAEDRPSYSGIANLIFVSGISTKEEVTNISGRGVGMDAVKEFLLAQGGDISLQLLGAHPQSDSEGQGVMVPFELIVKLPENTFTTMASIVEV